MYAARIVIGTTAQSLQRIMRGDTLTGASTSRAYPDLRNGVQRLLFDVDPNNTGVIYVGESDVSSINAGLVLNPGDRQYIDAPAGWNAVDINDRWLRGSAANQAVNVTLERQ